MDKIVDTKHDAQTGSETGSVLADKRANGAAKSSTLSGQEKAALSTNAPQKPATPAQKPKESQPPIAAKAPERKPLESKPAESKTPTPAKAPDIKPPESKAQPKTPHSVQNPKPQKPEPQKPEPQKPEPTLSLAQMANRLAQAEQTIASLGKQQSQIKQELAVGRVADVESLLLSLINCLHEKTNYSKPVLPIPSSKASIASHHGHQLLISIILSDFINERAFLSTPHDILEIGTTREMVWNQNSTSRLTCLARHIRCQLTSVDMDPSNGKRLLEVLDKGYEKHLNIVVSTGEAYLRDPKTKVPRYVYLDAYDFDHGNHSLERQAPYIKHLGDKISDERCAKMHLDCVKELVVKLPYNGVIVFDDVFYENGNWSGKGKKAVDYLLNNGFTIIAQTSMTIGLKRSNNTL